MSSQLNKAISLADLFDDNGWDMKLSIIVNLSSVF